MENLHYINSEIGSRVRQLKRPTRPLWPANENVYGAAATPPPVPEPANDNAAMARAMAGARAEAALAPGAVPELLFVVPDAGGGSDRGLRGRARRGGERMAAFAMIGFADLGLDMRCAVRSVAHCAALAARDPDATRARRFVWGRYDLFAKLAEALPAPASALGVDAAGGPV